MNKKQKTSILTGISFVILLLILLTFWQLSNVKESRAEIKEIESRINEMNIELKTLEK